MIATTLRERQAYIVGFLFASACLWMDDRNPTVPGIDWGIWMPCYLVFVIVFLILEYRKFTPQRKDLYHDDDQDPRLGY